MLTPAGDDAERSDEEEQGNAASQACRRSDEERLGGPTTNPATSVRGKRNPRLDMAFASLSPTPGRRGTSVTARSPGQRRSR